MQLNKFIGLLFVTFLIPVSVFAVTLPDFTELAETQGKTVVNITSIKNTSTPSGNTPPFPYDEQLQEFFKRFWYSRITRYAP